MPSTDARSPSTTAPTRTLALWQRAQSLPMGRHLFSQVFRFAAPYFRSIPAVVETVQPGRATARMTQRPWVRNHLGGVHAIALCNLAELTMGCVAEASVPASHRRVPKSMAVTYTAKAAGTMHCTANVEVTAEPTGVEVPVAISIRDDDGTEVLRGTITIWVSPRKDR